MKDDTVKSILIKKRKDIIKEDYINDLLRDDLTCIELIEILVDNQWDPCYFKADVSKEYFKEKHCELSVYITTGFRQVNMPCAATIHVCAGNEDIVHTFGIIDFDAKIYQDDDGKKWLYYDPCKLKFAYVGPKDYYPHLSQMTDELRLKFGRLVDYIIATSEEAIDENSKKLKERFLNSQYFEDENDLNETVVCLTDTTFISKPTIINDLLNDNQKFTLAKILALPVSFMQHDFNTCTNDCALELDGKCHKETPCNRQVLRPRHISIDIPWGTSIEEAFDKWIQKAGYEKDEAVRIIRPKVSTE